MAGGAGFIYDMLSRQKYNKSLRKKTTFLKTKRRFTNTAGKYKIEYQKASKKELELIRREMRKESRQRVHIYLFSMIMAIAIFTGLLYLAAVVFLN